MEKRPNGYMIQLYQYARRYRYNYEGSIKYFNYLIETPEHNKPLEIETDNVMADYKDNAYMVLGDFDILEIIPVDSFRKYHDVSDLAKKYLGRRQSVLLYCIDDVNMPPRIQYKFENKYWCNEKMEFINKRFFCLSMLSITNEAHTKIDIFNLLPKIREKILTIVDELNKLLDDSEKLICEVYGALNATEIGIVWLSNQYVDVLLFIDYLKHMKLHLNVPDDEDIPLFLASNTTITTKFDKDFNRIGLPYPFPDVKGSASVQISVHDTLESREAANKFIEKIVKEISECEVLYSTGEYDIIIQMPASIALKNMQKGQKFENANREEDGHYKIQLRDILRNNTQLLLHKEKDKNEKLETELGKQQFVLSFEIEQIKKNCSISKQRNLKWEEWMELTNPESPEIKKQLQEETIPFKSNNTYYNSIRRKMEKKIRPSAGAIDMLDLLYADYLSTLANAYNKMWVSDFHRQFKAVLHAIDLWIEYQNTQVTQSENKSDRQWEDFRDLTNAFKQQVYHLSQSSRMVLDIPRCHFRMTGQYDLLIHTYYGFAKTILESIYLMQSQEHQSELIPLITVNTVPQVKSELYFEYGSNDEMRVINLNIPASIVFDPQRGLRYLTHELFHYAVPHSREKRNYLMGCFIICECFKMQFLHIFNQMLYTSVDGIIDKNLKDLLTENVDAFHLSKLARYMFFTNYNEKGDEEKYWLDEEILNFIQLNAERWRHEDMIGCGIEDICTEYQRKTFKYCQKESSTKFFKELCNHLMNCIHERVFASKNKILKITDKFGMISESLKKNLNRLFDRLQYCIIHKEYCSLQFSGLRLDYAHNEDIGKVIKTVIWGAVKEACCDIAMVSLTSMGLDDYALFCIQSWKDSTCGELDVETLEEDQGLRFNFVFQYFSSMEIWNLNCLDDFKDSFIKKYMWFFAQRNPKLGENEFIYLGALKWWEYFMEGITKFQMDNKYFVIMFYDALFADILSDFDVKKRADSLINSNLGNKLKIIFEDIRVNVYDKYNSLISDTLPQKSNHLFEQRIFENLQKYEEYRNARFRCDLSVAKYFQHQKSFRELADLNSEIQKIQKNLSHWQPEIPHIKDSITFPEVPWEFHVHSLHELLTYLQYCEEKIQKGNAKEPIWFRGESRNSYNLLPSILRNFDREKCNDYSSLRAYQQCEFEEFKYRADGAPEIPSGVRFTTSDYIALMQHYSKPTNLLDWSENAFFALYFALENYFENIKDKKYSVSLYLLQPKRYNHLCLEKYKHTKKNSVEVDNWILNNSIRDLDSWIDYSIPNLSTKLNEKRFASYLLGELEFDNKFNQWLKLKPESYDNTRKNYINCYLPVAVWTSRLNTRIRAQSGCFVAFNLYTLPDICKQWTKEDNHAFDYISLDEIQKQIIADAPDRTKEDYIFLYKIIIDSICCNDIMKWLRGMGISRASVYPELDRIKIT